MNRLKALIREIHDRSLWQIVVAYAAGSWFVLQLADTVTAVLGLPDWVPQLAGVICLAALPLVLATEVVQRAAKKESYPFAESELGAFRRWLRWRRVGALLVAAFALLATGTAGYMGMRVLGIGPPATLIAQDLFEEHAQLVLAEFSGAGEDSILARAVHQGVRDEFLQSRVVTLADPRELRPILARMERPPNAPLDPETAREVAVRGGMPAVIEGEVLRVGEGYLLRAQIVSADSVEVLATHREASSGAAAEILDAIDRLSKGLRERIGESYGDLRQAKALPEVTTQSLEALEKYAQFFHAERAEDGLALLEEAVAIDSTFAMAWRRLGALLSTLWQEPARARQATARAFEHRERLPDRERYLVEGTYYMGRDPQASIEAYEARLESFPHDRDFNDAATRYNLGVTYRDAADPVGRLDRAEEVLREGLELYRGCSAAAELTRALIRLGKMDEAEETWEEYSCDERPNGWFWSATMATARGDYDRAEADLRRFLEETADDGSESVWILSILVPVLATEGRWAEAEDLGGEILGRPSEETLPPAYWDIFTGWAGLQLRVKNDTTAALATLERLLTPFATGEVDPQVAPHILWWAAEVYARAGQAERARDLLLQLDALGNPHVPEFPRAYAHLSGLLALREGRYEDALGEFQASEVGGECPILCAAPGLAEIYEALGQADSALAVYERYVTTPYEYRLFKWDQFFLAHALERAGQLSDERGDREKAAEYYSRFVELWADADPQFQPRIEAVRDRLAELRGG